MGAYGSPDLGVPPRQGQPPTKSRRRRGFGEGMLAGCCLGLIGEVAALVLVLVLSYHWAHP